MNYAVANVAHQIVRKDESLNRKNGIERAGQVASAGPCLVELRGIEPRSGDRTLSLLRA